MNAAGIAIRPLEAGRLQEAHRLELACYAPEAAATLPAFEFRQRHFPRYFLAAIDNNEKLVGLACGVRTAESDCAGDEVKGDHLPNTGGRHLCVLSVAVSPGGRRRGVGTALMTELLRQAEADRMESVILMCEPHLIGFYENLGFAYVGLSSSQHGGIAWHEMRKKLETRTNG